MGWLQGGVSEDDRLDREETGRVLRRTARLLGPYRRQAVLALVLLVLWTATLLAGPLLVRTAIDDGIRAGDARVLNLAVAGYVAAAVLSYVTYRAAILALARVGERFLRDLRIRVFDRLVGQSPAFYDREKAGVLVSRMTSDIDSLAELVQYGLLMFVSAVLLLTGTIVVLALLSWQLTLACFVAAPVVAVASRKFQRDSNRAYLSVRDHIGRTLTSLQEGLSGVRIVQAFGREDLQARRFAATNQALYRSHMDSVKVASWYLPVVEFSGALTTAIAIGAGGWMVRDGRLTLGTVVAFVLLLQSLFEPIQQLSQLFNMVQSSTASLAKLYGLVDTPVEVAEKPRAVELPARGDVTVEGMTFAYGGSAPVLHEVDLVIGVGERLALVGPTGAGKSTLAKLIARFYDPSAGRVVVGGVDLRDASLGSLRRRIVVVPQEGYLFSGTILDNIRVARPEATRAEVEQALRDLGVWDRVAAFPDGLDTDVRERGSRLSAGEKQLVSLARAALVDPSVLILDEATSSLDPGTEAVVEDAMETLMARRTTIVIAHRLSTSQRCDRVAVVADGRLAELGTHDELVAAGGRYATLYAAWVRGLATTAEGGER
jgi:ATP-binding cassette, subfamily B, bacterial